MKIGVPKEIKPQENRIGLTPESVKALTSNGHVVLVENNSEGVYSGRSRLDKLVYLDGENIEIGDFVEVKITEARTWSLTGEVQKKINYEIEGQLIEH